MQICKKSYELSCIGLLLICITNTGTSEMNKTCFSSVSDSVADPEPDPDPVGSGTFF